jgi:hypothetical protein
MRSEVLEVEDVRSYTVMERGGGVGSYAREWTLAILASAVRMVDRDSSMLADETLSLD